MRRVSRRPLVFVRPVVLGIATGLIGLWVAQARPTDAAFIEIGRALEARFDRAPLSAKDTVTGIVVLGGGTERAQEALALARRHPDARVVLSGASPAEEALLLGAPELAGRLSIDRRARDTFENATYGLALAAPIRHQRWLLVTSALHMPRSIGVFRAAGFEVEAWPVHDTPPEPRYAVPRVRHEVLGLVYYRLLGRTALLLPG